MNLTDTYTGRHVRVWVRWTRDGELEEVGSYMEGTPPGWWAGDGWQTELEEVAYGCEWPETLLLHGLAPGQPFLLEIYPPRVYRSGECGSETDVEWDWSIVDRAPLAPHLAAIRWEVWLRDQEADRRWEAQVAEQREREAREGPPMLHLPRVPKWAPDAWKNHHGCRMVCMGIGLGDQLVRQFQLDWTRRLPFSHFTDDPRHPKLCPRCRTVAAIRTRKALQEMEQP